MFQEAVFLFGVGVLLMQQCSLAHCGPGCMLIAAGTKLHRAGCEAGSARQACSCMYASDIGGEGVGHGCILLYDVSNAE
jgi:hypothetical protein